MTTTAEDTMKPIQVSDIDMTFGGDIRKLMPSRESFKPFERFNATWANRLVSDWFFSGLKSTDGLVVKAGIDKKAALRHIGAILRSFEPKHEHKEAACAYLFDLWFDGEKSKWERAK